MNKKIIFIMINLFLKIIPQEYGLVIEPVVDAIGEPLIHLPLYNTISLSPLNKKDNNSCPRIHQLLFNEIVKIIQKEPEEYIIELPSIFFQQKGTTLKKNKFRIHKKNLVSFSHLQKFNIDLDNFPKTIDYCQPKDTSFANTVSLKGPFNDPKTKKVYSAGTRFIYSNQDEDHYDIYVFNPLNNHFVITSVPKKLCINHSENNSNEKKIRNFIKLLKKWANLKSGFIPYVWGGCSFCSTHNNENFIEVKKLIHKKEFNYYEYLDYDQKPKNGFDCTGIVLRAAQICGLPYYFKNSTTVEQNIRPINQNETISNGDIIWIPGHILVITDIDKNLVVEATDYSSGYGKTHEIEISKLFKNMKDFNDLQKAYFAKKGFERLNKQGKIFQNVPTFKLLKLSSIWEN